MAEVEVLSLMMGRSQRLKVQAMPVVTISILSG